MHPDKTQLQALIRGAAQDELLPRFTRVEREMKSDGSILTEADLAMDRRLKEELSRSWPAVTFLSEEMDADDQRDRLATAKYGLWCVDPLDGTTNFAAALPFFAVSLAFILGGEPIIGLVYDPVRDETFVAEKGKGATLNGQKLVAKPTDMSLRHAVAMVDLKRIAPNLGQRLIREAPYKSQRNLGSCALEWSWIAAGRGQVYLHGGQKLWDLAAGSLILHEAGGHASTLEGDPVFKPTLRPRSVVAARDEALFRDWLEWLAQSVG